MLITVAEALLGWLPLRVSLTLAAILTVILLVMAVAMLKRSLLLSVTALSLIGMTWRSEAWKAAYLEAEAQLTRVQQLQPKIESNRRVASFACADAQRVPQTLSSQSVGLSFQEFPPRLVGIARMVEAPFALYGVAFGRHEAHQDSNQDKHLILQLAGTVGKSVPLPGNPLARCLAETEPADSPYNVHTEAGPTPFYENQEMMKESYEHRRMKR